MIVAYRLWIFLGNTCGWRGD